MGGLYNDTLVTDCCVGHHSRTDFELTRHILAQITFVVRAKLVGVVTLRASMTMLVE